jgi:thioredoxin-dependent peroxiredoxin
MLCYFSLDLNLQSHSPFLPAGQLNSRSRFSGKRGFEMKKLFALVAVFLLVISFISGCTAQSNAASQAPERANVINLQGNPLTLIGPELKVGQKAPDFNLVTPYEKLETLSTSQHINLAASTGRVRFFSLVPSLDTPVCDLQTQRFEAEAAKYSNVEFYTISADLPFAQFRYCGSKDVTHMQVLSDYYDLSFGRAYGVLIKELHLESRSIFIVDAAGTIKYTQFVKDISQPVDFDAALAALQNIINASLLTTTPAPTAAPSPTTSTTLATGAGNQPGNIAPPIQLNDAQGNPVSLKSFLGKPVLLNFWATWCPFCQAERPLIQTLYNGEQAAGYTVLTVDIIGSRSTETPANLTDFMQKNQYTFTVLLDVNELITKEYGIVSTPTSFLIDKNGVIQVRQTGAFPSETALQDAMNKLLAK